MEVIESIKPLLQSIILLTLQLISLTVPVNTLNILTVLPSVWKSHYIYGRRLVEELVLRHPNTTATLISPHAGETYLHKYPSLAGISEIHIDGLLQNWLEMGLNFNVEQVRQKSVLERFTRLIYAGTTNIDLLLADEKVQNILESDAKYDLLLVDLYMSEALLGFSYYYQVPTIILNPTSADVWLDDILGNPHQSALDGSRFLPYTEQMNFWERTVNTLMIFFEQLTYNFFHWNSQTAIFEKNFGSLPRLANTTLPTYSELMQHISLVLINSHPLLQYPRAYLPNMVENAGSHLQLHRPHSDCQQLVQEQQLESETLELPNHLRQFIEDAPMGVVYMSLGADIQTVDLSSEHLNAFLDAFAQLKDMRFLVKWERESLTEPRFPTNVLVNPWFPQESILMHPNVKAFISSAGLLSVMEALNGLTPLLVIPIYSDQMVTAKRLHGHGVAVTVPFDEIDYHRVLNGIQEITTNQSYTENLMKLRRYFWSQYNDPLERSLHHIQMIVDTDGGQFMKSHIGHMGFLRAGLYDVVSSMVLGVLIIMTIVFLIVHKILQLR